MSRNWPESSGRPSSFLPSAVSRTAMRSLPDPGPSTRRDAPDVVARPARSRATRVRGRGRPPSEGAPGPLYRNAGLISRKVEEGACDVTRDLCVPGPPTERASTRSRRSEIGRRRRCRAAALWLCSVGCPPSRRSRALRRGTASARGRPPARSRRPAWLPITLRSPVGPTSTPGRQVALGRAFCTTHSRCSAGRRAKSWSSSSTSRTGPRGPPQETTDGSRT